MRQFIKQNVSKYFIKFWRWCTFSHTRGFCNACTKNKKDSNIFIDWSWVDAAGHVILKSKKRKH